MHVLAPAKGSDLATFSQEAALLFCAKSAPTRCTLSDEVAANRRVIVGALRTRELEARLISRDGKTH